MSVGDVLACVVDAAPVSLLFGLIQANRRLRYLLPKNAKLHICFGPIAPPETHSVAVKQLNARSFRLLRQILECLVDVGPLFHFFLRKRQRRRALKTKRVKTQPLFQPVPVSRGRFQSRKNPHGAVFVRGSYCWNCRRCWVSFFFFDPRTDSATVKKMKRQGG